MSLLVIHIILGLFFHTLTANDKYCLPHGDNLGQVIQMELSKKKCYFSVFDYIFEI